MLLAASTTQPSGVAFKLEGDSDKWDPVARDQIVKAMTVAVAVYNRYSSLAKLVPVVYSPQTPTADANYDGHIRFGGQIGTRTALHEMAHIFGVGTYPAWQKFVVDGKWTGPHAIAQLKAFDGPNAVLHADHQHFWPYGLNYDREGSTPEQLRRNVLMVLALRKDMGIDFPE